MELFLSGNVMRTICDVTQTNPDIVSLIVGYCGNIAKATMVKQEINDQKRNAFS